MADHSRDQMTSVNSGAEPHAMLRLALAQLHDVVVSLDPTEMDAITNCEPWTVRRLASHALNNQLLWGGLVTGQQLVSLEDTMGAGPHDGDLAAFADDVAGRTMEMWGREGALDATYHTPFGMLPGLVVVTFPTIDAVAHAWDLSST